uniref:NB-ARC domain-containing protein n=1 Tax=Salix viminalis TaxID=40686 RepID=A0A6N2M1V5_SALVM
MTDALVSPILELLLKIAAQQVQEEVNLVGVEKQVDKLRSNLIDIQSVLEDAERKQVKVKAVRVWLDKLKDVQEEVNLVVGVEKQVDKLKSNLIDIQSVIEDAERKQVKDKAVRVWLDKLKDGFDVVILPSRSKQLVKNWMRLPKRKEPIPVTQLVRETAAVMQESTHQVPTSHGKPWQWRKMFQMQKHFLRRDLKGRFLGKTLKLGKLVVPTSHGKPQQWGKMFQMQKHFLKNRVLTPAKIDDYLAEGIDIVFFGSSGVLPCLDTNRDTSVTFLWHLLESAAFSRIVRTTMADALVSPILELLIKIGAQQVQEEVNLVVGVKNQVDKLKSNLIDIRSVLEDAERKQVKDKAIRVWLDKLKDICYDMDDVLDEWSTAILTWEMDEENTRSLKKMRCSFMRSPCFCLNQRVRQRDIALKIKEVSEKVDEIAKEKAMYGFQLYEATDHELHRPTSTQFFDESSVCGRDGEKKSVVSKLLAESSQEARDVDVISLIGLGGIGKTTIAQLAFNDAEVMTHFEKKIWVCVSEPFDEVRIAKAILKQLEGSTSNLDDLQSLLQRVSQSINGIRVLLVLDDVWTEDHRHWEQLKPSLAGCARGSKILVTTRKGVVATMMGTDHRINIETLSDDACRSIFNHVAFHERSNDERERLTDIGNKIASKCKGLPLVAKVLGGLMQSKRTRKEWEDVLSSELWRLDEVDKDQVEKKLFLPLHLSYYDLPSVVRRCFLYCAMFPKDYEMKKDELVKMWMAQGYLKETPSRDMEVVGEQYFQVLVVRSFFQDMKKSLNLSWSLIEEIPKEVGKLIHLRHLNLEYCRELVSLPETMCDLCNLQSLDVIGCLSLKELPLAIAKLIKLRHLCIYDSGVAFMPKGIERLTCLRTLDCFMVYGGGENESKAANLRELKNLDHIGRLVIENLQGGDIEDAAEAQLKNKKRLLCLDLNFCKEHEIRLGGIEDSNLIEVLQLPPDLERLSIRWYGGIVLPNWMMALTRLQELRLVGCGNLQVLPSLVRLPNLESLVLQDMGVKRLDAGFLGIEEVENANINEGEIARVTAFPKLETLVILRLNELEEWDGIERRVGEEDATTTSIFIIMPRLQQLSIRQCPLGVRPFGVSLLVSGFDDKGLRLYQLCMALNCTKPLIMNCRDYQVTPLLMTRACVAEMMKRKVL